MLDANHSEASLVTVIYEVTEGEVGIYVNTLDRELIIEGEIKISGHVKVQYADAVYDCHISAIFSDTAYDEDIDDFENELEKELEKLPKKQKNGVKCAGCRYEQLKRANEKQKQKEQVVCICEL